MKNVAIVAGVALAVIPLGCASEPARAPAQPAIVHAPPAARTLGSPELQPAPVAAAAEPAAQAVATPPTPAPPPRPTMIELAPAPASSADVDAFDLADDAGPPPTATAPSAPTAPTAPSAEGLPPLSPDAVIAVKPDGTPVRAGRTAPAATPPADAGPAGSP